MKRIHITEPGFELLDRIAAVGDMLDEQLFGAVTKDELASAIDVMMRVKSNLRTALGGQPSDASTEQTARADAVAQVEAFRPAPKPRHAATPVARRRGG